MKRALMILIATGLIVLCALLIAPNMGLPSAVVAQSNPTQTVAPASAALTAALLVPDACKPPCIWQFQPGKQTLAEFNQLVQTTLRQSTNTFSDADRGVVSLFGNGVGVYASTGPKPTASTVVDYFYVRVDVAQARAASVTLDSFAPAAIVRAFGAPADAYLLSSTKKLRRYALLLYYPARSMVYTMRSAYQNGQACLTLDGVETLTLYRFADSAAAEKFIRDASSTDNTLPASISSTTKQTPKDLAQNQGTVCLVPR